MTMSTQTLDEAAVLLEQNVLLDTIQIFNVSEPITVGTRVTRPLTPVGMPVPGLIQGTTLENAVESQTSTLYSVKVSRRTPLKAGQAVKLLNSRSDPDLVGVVLLVDKVSSNGMAVIRKGVASKFEHVNQQGKGVI